MWTSGLTAKRRSTTLASAAISCVRMARPFGSSDDTARWSADLSRRHLRRQYRLRVLSPIWGEYDRPKKEQDDLRQRHQRPALDWLQLVVGQ
eukprot:4912585-Pleurochrysis_carterae.AAC.1